MLDTNTDEMFYKPMYLRVITYRLKKCTGVGI